MNIKQLITVTAVSLSFMLPAAAQADVNTNPIIKVTPPHHGRVLDPPAHNGVLKRPPLSQHYRRVLDPPVAGKQ